jgi:outer membrane immunogenic protein
MLPDSHSQGRLERIDLRDADLGAIMKKLFLASAAVIALAAGPASAADLRAKPVYKAPPSPPVITPVYNWTGFYAGLNAGWGWINDQGQPFCVSGLTGTLNGPGCFTNNVPGAQIKGNGFIAGGQVGYNWQTSSNWLLGVETDFQGSDIKGSVNIPGPWPAVPGGVGAPFAGTNFSAHERLSWFGTLRGRIGVVWNGALLYATGGLAYGHVNVDQNTIFGPPVTPTFVAQYPSSTSVTKTGWTAGGGFEWALAPTWSAKIEGLYYDLGTVTTSGGAVPPIELVSRGGKNFDVRGGIVRVGLNWRFGWGGPVVARY